MADNKKVYFEFDSRILTQLGEKLVPNKAVALAELVKNSYDADATSVLIQARNIKRRGGTIIVDDNGLGIPEFRFQETWMRVATLDKEANPFSFKFRRQRAGEKGIGRFACRRLSKKLKLISVSELANGEKERITVVFNWEDFKAGSDANKIGNDLIKENVDKNLPTGTKLVLEGVYDAWDGRSIKKLKNELKELFAPTPFKDLITENDPGFNIDFDIPEFQGGVLSTDSQFFNSSWAKVTGHVDEDGTVSYTISTINKILRTINREFHKEAKFSHIKNITFEAHIFPYKSSLFNDSTWKMDQVRKINIENGGIKVYADQFRVFGYGGESNDWLDLNYDRSRSLGTLDKEINILSEEDKRPGLRLFRTQNIFGYVMFRRYDNPELEITINRDRLLENDAFEELKQFARLGIEFATVLYSNEVYKEQQILDRQRIKMEEERERRAEEEKRKAEEEKRVAEEEKRKAEERARKFQEERIKAEERARQAEEKRRNAEKERRKIEEEILSKLGSDYSATISSVLKKETELLEIEESERKREAEARIKAEEEKRKAEEKIRHLEEKRRRDEEERRRIAEEKLVKEKRKYELERSQLRVLASTGTQVLILEHELQALIEDMETMIDNYSYLLSKIPENEQIGYQEDLQSFADRTDMITEFGKFLGFTISKESRLEKLDWVLLSVIAKVHKPFQWYFRNNGIDFDISSVPDDITTPKMYRSELASVIYNILSNALKATKGRQDRRIKIVAFEDREKLYIQFLDSGVGLEEERWEIVFEPFETFSEPDLRFGVGTGLGLKLVKDIIEAYNGSVSFKTPPDNWNACLEIVLPLEE